MSCMVKPTDVGEPSSVQDDTDVNDLISHRSEESSDSDSSSDCY